MIGNRFWHSKEQGRQIPVYFVDSFDLGKDYDKEKTQDELRRMLRLAKDNQPFVTKNMKKCMSVKWRDHKDRIMTIHLNMLGKEFIRGFCGLGPEELNYFEKRACEIMKPIEADNASMELSPADFFTIEHDLFEARDRAVICNINQLRNEKKYAEE